MRPQPFRVSTVPPPAQGWRPFRAFAPPMSMTPRSRSGGYFVRMRSTRSGIPGRISMRCTTARRSTDFRSTTSPMAVRYRSIRAASIASFCCRCRSAAGRRSGPAAATSSPAPRGGVVVVADAADPDDLARRLRATDPAGGPAPDRKPGGGARGTAGRPGGVRPPDRSRHAFWPALCNSTSNIWSISPSTAGPASVARRDAGDLARVRCSDCFSPASPHNLSAGDQSIGAAVRRAARRRTGGRGPRSRRTRPSRSIWKNWRGCPASVSGRCNSASSVISASRFPACCRISAWNS